MFCRILKVLLACLCALAPIAVFADSGLGAVANNLLGPVGIFSSFINVACFIIGAAFIFATIVKYIEHRRSPLMVPISTVIFLAIAGLVLIGLPFLSLLSGNGSPVS